MPIASILAIIITVSVLGGFGGGYFIEKWRMSGELERVKAENTVLTQANGKCADDIAEAKTAMAQIITATQEREKQAADAMQKAQPQVEQRQAVITKIKSRPEVALNMQCEAIKQEQIIYVQARRAE